MQRRKFIENALMLTGGISFPHVSLFKKDTKSIRFGIITDIHYANRGDQDNRFYRQSLDKLSECISVMNREEVNFLIELGDFKDRGINAKETLKFLTTVEKEFQRFNGDSYHVLGNHDTDTISKKQFLDRISNTGFAETKSYYSFKAEGFQFIVLDANFSSKGISYNKGNINWKDCHIPQKQLNWLKMELTNQLPTIIFIHQRLDSLYSLRDFCPDNADEVRGVLEASGNVLAVFQGHDHRGGFNKLNNIPYYTLRAVIEGSGIENSSYAIVNIQKDFKNSFVIDIKGYHKAVSMLLQI